ncbi:hypothetical protein DW049_11400 [Ruminococcus sp. AF41-9]|jgi:FMN-dependent NADH-azoreductase|nr:hypothetical protein DW049_11400 [Ruminococcus sp. AF41-9]
MKNILIISSSPRKKGNSQILCELDGFVEHLEEYKIAGKIYAANVMDAGLVRNQSVFKKAYDMGYSVQNAEKLRVGE